MWRFLLWNLAQNGVVLLQLIRHPDGPLQEKRCQLQSVHNRFPKKVVVGDYVGVLGPPGRNALAKVSRMPARIISGLGAWSDASDGISQSLQLAREFGFQRDVDLLGIALRRQDRRQAVRQSQDTSGHDLVCADPTDLGIRPLSDTNWLVPSGTALAPNIAPCFNLNQ